MQSFRVSSPALTVALLSLAALTGSACDRAALRGLPPGQQCTVPTDCPAPPGDASCLASVQCSIRGECLYEFVAPGGACDDLNPCTNNTTCNDVRQCTGGDVPVGDACEVGTAAGVCIEEDVSGRGVCSPNHCFIDGALFENGDHAPSNVCAFCSAQDSRFAWHFELPGTLCDDDDDPEKDGVCAPVGALGSEVICRHDRCYIDQHLYEAGDVRPDAECELCDPSQGETFLTHWYSSVGRVCPLGCSLTPTPHCVQPSNWGYWDGAVAHDEGLTIDWIEADYGGSHSLVFSSATIAIDTRSSGAPVVTINGSPLTMSEGVDYRVVPQAAFHDGTASRPRPAGVSAGEIPDLVAIKFKSIAVTGTATVTCVGERPLALASVGTVELGGTWNVRCGRAASGEAQSAAAGADPYAIRGGGGGGGGGHGGDSGPSGSNIEGGAQFGRAELQPLLGGGDGGAGAAAKGLIKDGLGGDESTLACWGHPGYCGGTSQWDTFSEWESNVWPTFAAPTASGGEGGGALQVVALSALTLSGQVLAWGKGGAGQLDCAAQTAGTIGDNANYPIKWDCGGCPDASYATRWWRSWLLQTGGGGGAGGSLLVEAPAVTLADTAQLNAVGGGGGAACYTNTHNANVCYASPMSLTSYGSEPGSSYWGPMSGGEGGASADGVSSPYAPLNPGSLPCDPSRPELVELQLPSDETVSWGGAGGAAGRIRIHTPDGNVSCGASGCSSRTTPSIDLTCSTNSTAAVCRFPADDVHYKN